MGILIEHYAGNFPLWLSPTQASILTISEKHNQFALELRGHLQKNKIRTNLDLRNEKIGFKIREHTLQKVPYLLIIGDKEVESKTVAVRTKEGANLGEMSLDTLCETLQRQIAAKN